MVTKDDRWLEEALRHGRGLVEKAKVNQTTGVKAELKVVHEVGSTITVHNRDGKLLLGFHYAQDFHYPYWYPLCTPSGVNIGILSPKDHVWHRGLWMVWKYVNRVNFWEGPFTGDDEFGMHYVSEIETISTAGNAASVRMKVKWITNKGKNPLDETRTWKVTVPASDSEYYYMDMASELKATAGDATIESVSLKQYSWGGYGGLFIRTTRDLAGHTDKLIKSNNGKVDTDVHGNAGDWSAYCGVRDGSVGKEWVGFALIDHTANPVHPVPFHASCEGIVSIGTAPVRFEPIVIKRGESKTFKNRVVVFDGETKTELIQKLFEDFTANDQS